VTDNYPDRLVRADDLERDGFQQLFLLPITWSDVWTVWPDAHHQALPETREVFWRPRQSRGDGPVCHLIRSPWDSVPLEDLLAVIRVRVVRHPDWEINEQRAVDAAREVLAWGEARILREVAALPASDDRG
jgi:hypothetical protein